MAAGNGSRAGVRETILIGLKECCSLADSMACGADQAAEWLVCKL